MDKKIGAPIIGGIFLLVIIGAGAFFSTRSQNKEFVEKVMNPNDNPRLKADFFTPDIKGFNAIFSSAATEAFTANLEYNPTTNSVFQKSVRKTKIDVMRKGSPTTPTSADDFIYNVTVLTNKNELLQNGWYSQPLFLTKTQRNTLLFSIQTLYQKNAIVYVSLPNNKIIWTGVIP